MKKALYIVGMIAILFISGSASYYFITQANIQKQEQNKKNQAFINQEIEKCERKYEGWKKTNSYDWDNGTSSESRIPKISYSLELNACIGYRDDLQYREYNNSNGWNLERNYSAKIIDLSHEQSLFFCGSNVDEDCGYEKFQSELKKWIAQ